MDKKPNYFFLAGVFFVAYLVVQFTDIYGDPTWFKVFVLIVSGSFLVSGLLSNKKEEDKVK